MFSIKRLGKRTEKYFYLKNVPLILVSPMDSNSLKTKSNLSSRKYEKCVKILKTVLIITWTHISFADANI